VDKDGGNSFFQSAMLPFVAGHSAFFFFFAFAQHTETPNNSKNGPYFLPMPLFLDIFFSNIDPRQDHLT